MQIEPPSPLNFSMNPPSKSMSEIPGRPDVTKSQQKTFFVFLLSFLRYLFFWRAVAFPHFLHGPG